MSLFTHVLTLNKLAIHWYWLAGHHSHNIYIFLVLAEYVDSIRVPEGNFLERVRVDGCPQQVPASIPLN